METISSRLAGAIKSGPRSCTITDFEERLKELQTDIPGSSYAQIHRYLNGSATPSVEFLRAAAEVLGVREPWLISGQGEMTEDAEERRIRDRGLRLARSGSASSEALASAVLRISEEYPPFRNVPVEYQVPITGAWLQCAEVYAEAQGKDRDDFFSTEPEHASELAGAFGQLLSHPFEILDINREGNRLRNVLSGWNEDLYLQAMGQVATLLVRLKAHQVRGERAGEPG